MHPAFHTERKRFGICRDLRKGHRGKMDIPDAEDLNEHLLRVYLTDTTKRTTPRTNNRQTRGITLV